jgi:hypothetical protein
MLSLSQQTQVVGDDQDEENGAASGMNDRLLSIVIPAEDQVEDAWRKELLKWQRNYYNCTRCGRPFRELDNIGQWNCTQHAYSALRTSTPIPGDKWPCCGRLIKSDTRNDHGCIPCDHTIFQKAWDHTGDYQMPILIFQQYFKNVRPEAIITTVEYQKSRSINQPFPDNNTEEENEFAKAYAFIRRFDKSKHDEQAQRVYMTLTPDSNSINVKDRTKYKWRQTIR